MQTSYLFLKPETTRLEDWEKQEQDIKKIILPAIAYAELSAIDDQTEGFVVFGISDAMIQKTYKADILIIDANRYETSGTFQLSPYLYYYMAIGHSRGNATILLTNTAEHLPPNLVKYHTLTYSAAEAWAFVARFVNVVDEIRKQQNTQPDNPIQDYLKENPSQQIAILKARKQRVRPPIVIHPVEKDWG
jgi:hypothetical protein